MFSRTGKATERNKVTRKFNVGVKLFPEKDNEIKKKNDQK